jgi:hypothetical protein
VTLRLEVDRGSLWRAFDERATREEDAYVRAALVRFGFEDEQLRAILARTADVFVAASLARILGELSPGGDWHARWLRDYLRLIQQTVRVGGEHVADQVGVRFDLENPRVRAVIRARAGALVQHVTETTRASIRAAVEQGRAQGLGTREIARLIHDTTFGEITKTRAVTIARTETVGAMNAGEHQAAVQSGVMRSKEWLTQGDGRVRDTHRALDGVRVDLGAAFPNGLQHPHAPGAPAKEVVNCRCTLLYSDEEAA